MQNEFAYSSRDSIQYADELTLRAVILKKWKCKHGQSPRLAIPSNRDKIIPPPQIARLHDGAHMPPVPALSVFVRQKRVPVRSPQHLSTRPAPRKQQPRRLRPTQQELTRLLGVRHEAAAVYRARVAAPRAAQHPANPPRDLGVEGACQDGEDARDICAAGTVAVAGRVPQEVPAGDEDDLGRGEADAEAGAIGVEGLDGAAGAVEVVPRLEAGDPDGRADGAGEVPPCRPESGVGLGAADKGVDESGKVEVGSSRGKVGGVDEKGRGDAAEGY